MFLEYLKYKRELTRRSNFIETINQLQCGATICFLNPKRRQQRTHQFCVHVLPELRVSLLACTNQVFVHFQLGSYNCWFDYRVQLYMSFHQLCASQLTAAHRALSLWPINWFYGVDSHYQFCILRHTRNRRCIDSFLCFSTKSSRYRFVKHKCCPISWQLRPKHKQTQTRTHQILSFQCVLCLLHLP